MFLNNTTGTVFFAESSTGDFYALNGSTANKFTFSSGRELYYNNILYSTGFNFNTSGTGFIAELYWNGSYYYLLSNTGNGTPQ